MNEMDFDLPAVGPGSSENNETDDEDLPPSRIEYLNYRVVQSNDEWSLDDEDLFDKAAEAELDELDYGVIEVDRSETLLRSAEDNGLKWPFQCRSGTCAMCASVLKSGEAEMDMNLFLEDEEVDDLDLRLTCTCHPKSDKVQLVFNAIQTSYMRRIAQNRG